MVFFIPCSDNTNILKLPYVCTDGMFQLMSIIEGSSLTG